MRVKTFGRWMHPGSVAGIHSQILRFAQNDNVRRRPACLCFWRATVAKTVPGTFFPRRKCLGRRFLLKSSRQLLTLRGLVDDKSARRSLLLPDLLES